MERYKGFAFVPRTVTEPHGSKQRGVWVVKKKGFSWSALAAVAASVAIIAGVSYIYIRQLNQTVAKNTYANISELAKHDRRILEINIQNMWDRLGYLEKKLKNDAGSTLEETQGALNVETQYGEFERLYLVAEDGKVYSDRYVTYDPKRGGWNGRLDFLPLFRGGKEEIIGRYSDSVGYDAMRGERILYGIRTDGLTVGGIRMAAIVGVNRVTEIQENMISDIYVQDGVSRGFSTVIDQDGRFIVNTQRSLYTNWESGMYETFSRYRDMSLTEGEIAQKISQNATFNLVCVDDQGVRRQILFTPFENGSGWYFMVSVEDSVFVQQSRTFLAMSIVMLLLVTGTSMATLVVFMRAKNDLLRANAEAKARSDFLSTMSHEIRTPLNGVIGLLHLLETDVEKGAPVQVMKDRLAKARETAMYLLGLVSDILDMSKLQSGKADLLNQPVSVRQIVEGVCAMQRDNIQNRGISFVVEQDVPIPWIVGDEVRIKQILLNIIGNSAKFTPAGGEISLRVSQKREDDDHVATTFVCADTGCGMSPQFLEHIWESFSQERNKNAESVKGTGLGMAITKQLVDAMGAEIAVQSEIDKGTVFTVTLHSAIADAPAQVPAVAAGAQAGEQGHIHSILVAEDNPLNAEILTEILEDAGYAVALAKNGKEALDQFRQSAVGAFDLILMDVKMPVMDGCEAASAIRGLDRPDAKSVYIFACTANTFQEDNERAMRSGMNGFLAKPIHARELLQKLRMLPEKGQQDGDGDRDA